MSKPMLVFSGLVVLALAYASSPGTMAQPPARAVPLAGRRPLAPTTEVLRVVQTHNGAWVLKCFGFPCGGGSSVSAVVPTPDGADTFDVVVTVTMDYATSPGDRAGARMFYCRGARGYCYSPFRYLAPGSFPLATSTGDSVTLAWAANGLKADPDGWTYGMWLSLHDGSGDDKAQISGKVSAAVFEMTPAP
jgi:hypothetical protein